MADSTFRDLWEAAVGEHGDRPFLTFESATGDVEHWTYAQFDECVLAVAAGLQARGVGRGDAVHLVLANCPAFIALWLAAARVGAWIVPVDPKAASAEIKAQIDRIRPRIAFCATERAANYLAGADGAVESIVELAEDSSDLRHPSALFAGGGGESEPERPSPEDRLAVMFTSGTTSQPKGVVLTHANYSYVARAMARIFELESNQRWLVTLPLFHANAQYYCFSSAIATGAGVALMSSFSASGWLGQARRHSVTHASLFAAPMRMILARRPADAPSLDVKVWYAQNVSPKQYREFEGLVGQPPSQLYGMTETLAIVFADRRGSGDGQSIGTPVLDRRVRLLRPDDGVEAEDGEIGDLQVAGEPGTTLFLEYLDDPSTTGRAFTNEGETVWFNTGDRVVRVDGQHSFVGRADDVIKVAGENVSLNQIEMALADAPGILELVAVAKKDQIRDQVPVVFAVPANPDDPPKTSTLETWAAERLSPANRPRAWHLVPELPRTSVGKIRRFLLEPESERG